MQIVKTDFVEGARQARGIAVVIDVFRAFTVACYCVANGATRILPVAAVEEALFLKQSIPDSILIGERHGKKLQGFDFGNCPTELQGQDFTGRTVIHTTHAGTQGLVSATGADQALTGAFVNAAATAAWIRGQNPEQVTLVRMGWEARTSSEEDTLCADYLEALLLGLPFDLQRIEQLKTAPCAERFHDPAQPWSPASDLDYCLRPDQFPFALKVARSGEGLLELEQIQVQDMQGN